MSDENSVNRRDFLKTTSIAGSLTGFAASAFARPAGKMAPARVIGANDKINVGVIGVGGRGSYVAKRVRIRRAKRKIPAGSPPFATSTRSARWRRPPKYGVTGYLDYREMLDQGRCRCGHRRDAGPLARHDRARGDGSRQGRLPREADVPHHRRSQEARRHGEGNQARPAGRLADHVGRSVAQGEEGDCRRHARPDDHEPGLVPPQLEGRRVELADRCGRRSGRQGRQLHRLEDVARPRAEARLGSPTGSSASASIGTTPAASRPTCSITSSRR